MWLRFLSDFTFWPPEKRCVCIAYKAGMVAFVRSVCAKQAIEKGLAVLTERPQ